MSTYSASRREDVFTARSMEGSVATIEVKIPQVLWVADYGLKFYIRSISTSGKRLENHTPHTE
jgi:hypothetical protein